MASQPSASHLNAAGLTLLYHGVTSIYVLCPRRFFVRGACALQRQMVCAWSLCSSPVCASLVRHDCNRRGCRPGTGPGARIFLLHRPSADPPTTWHDSRRARPAVQPRAHAGGTIILLVSVCIPYHAPSTRVMAFKSLVNMFVLTSSCQCVLMIISMLLKPRNPICACTACVAHGCKCDCHQDAGLAAGDDVSGHRPTLGHAEPQHAYL